MSLRVAGRFFATETREALTISRKPLLSGLRDQPSLGAPGQAVWLGGGCLPALCGKRQILPDPPDRHQAHLPKPFSWNGEGHIQKVRDTDLFSTVSLLILRGGRDEGSYYLSLISLTFKN